MIINETSQQRVCLLRIRNHLMDYKRGGEDLKLDNRTKPHQTHTNMHTYITHIALCVHTDIHVCTSFI